jgi:hypothetical protein
MRILLFLLVISSSLASNRVELQKVYRSKDYRGVISMADKYPSLFSTDAENLSVLAVAYFHVEDLHLAVKTCAFAMNIDPSLRPCNVLVQRVKKENRKAFDLGVGIYEHELHNHKRAFIKFSKLVEENPENDLYRTWLMQNLYAAGFLDYAMEQLWEIKETNDEVRLMQRTLESRKRSLVAWFRRLSQKKLTDEHADILYQYLFFEQQSNPDKIAFLRSVYEREEKELGFSQKNALRNANLMLLEKRIADVKKYMDGIEANIVEPLYRFSLDSIYRRIGRLENPETSEEMEALQARLGRRGGGSPALAAASGKSDSGPAIEQQSEFRRQATFDFSDLMFASPEDLSAYEEISREFDAALAANPPMSVKRWLYKQIDDAADEMFGSERTEAAAQAFAATDKGKSLKEKMAKLEQEILVEDQKNASRFANEKTYFDKDFEKAATKEQKLMVLQNYITKWNRIANGDDTCLETQGAFHAFGSTPEGKSLKKHIFGLVQEFEIIPPTMLIEQEFLDELEL